MRIRHLLVGFILTLGFLFPYLVWNPALSAAAIEPDVDLGIGDEGSGRPNLRADELLYNRPAILIAWRNTAKILEVEVLIRNLGNDQGQGKVYMEILDEYGKSLARMPARGQEPTVTVPGRTEGGQDGKIVQLAGTKALNALIDRLDRDRAKYYIKATVDTLGKDKNLIDNTKVKSYNRNFRARPGSVHFFDSYFTNTTDRPVTVRFFLDVSRLPKAWELETRPAPGETVTLAPNQALQGIMLLRTPREIIDGDRVEIRMSALAPDGAVVAQTEWHLVNDNTPPEVISPTITLNKHNNEIDVALTADDKQSGIYEASGVRAEYTTDQGATYSTRVISYLSGNFVNPTTFASSLGPFRPNTTVQVSLSVMDLAGNIVRTKPVAIAVGDVTIGTAGTDR